MAKRVAVNFAENTSSALGMDVSKWQDGIDLKDVIRLNAVKFCICRTGDGKDPDNTFQRFYSTVMEAGAIPGSYHYFRADRDGGAQARSMAAELRLVRFIPGQHLPPAVDFEDGANLNLPGGVYDGSGKVMPIRQVHEELLEFLHELELQLGVRPMLYTGQTFHWWMSQAEPELAKEYANYPLWTPSYVTTLTDKSRPRMPADSKGNPFPWKEPTIWQYTGSGKFGGYSRDLDINLFNGDYAALQRFCKMSVVGPGAPPVYQAPVVEVKPDPMNTPQAKARISEIGDSLKTAADSLARAYSSLKALSAEVK